MADIHELSDRLYGPNPFFHGFNDGYIAYDGSEQKFIYSLSLPQINAWSSQQVFKIIKLLMSSSTMFRVDVDTIIFYARSKTWCYNPYYATLHSKPLRLDALNYDPAYPLRVTYNTQYVYVTHPRPDKKCNTILVQDVALDKDDILIQLPDEMSIEDQDVSLQSVRLIVRDDKGNQQYIIIFDDRWGYMHVQPLNPGKYRIAGGMIYEEVDGEDVETQFAFSMMPVQPLIYQSV